MPQPMEETVPGAALSAAILPVTPLPPPRQRSPMLAPLGGRTFRTIWSASLISNFGQLIQGVGAAWAMTRMSSDPTMVALVQTAIMLPLMLVAMPAGAIADMFDRRKVALVGLAFACVSAAALTTCALAGLLTPWLLLAFCFLIGTGVALYGPAWQSSIGEQVPSEQLPAAIALGSISYNIARSFGPAIGGVIVAALGSVAAFGVNALAYLPLMVAMALWRRTPTPSRLPPERIDRAIISGARYVIHSPPIRIILIRTLVSGIVGASISALTPLIAKDLLGGGASTYGLLLGTFGVGSVVGALFIARVRGRVDPEVGVRGCALLAGAMIAVVGASRNLWLTGAALLFAGAAWTLLVALFNVGVQLSAPRWVTARAVAWFSTAITGGIAFGAWLWGQVAAAHGVGTAMTVSGILIMLTPLLGVLLPMPKIAGAEVDIGERGHAPAVALALTNRSGPINIEVDYRVDPADARAFYDAMQGVRRARLRSGGFEWSLARDIEDPALWTERYHCPTWGDYLRQRTRATQSDDEAQARAEAFNSAAPGDRVRRRLERPFGSVRWRADTPDPQGDAVTPYPS
ncbi:MFS transporter [uncultured Sphingomonas sp.]|uniref:MFS transporter n=1 Tax=uncultured Sphingomonas sp. TaxID=158754 RepID=UPI00262CD7C5|nr:MFS transporter [uncultured Sphingomonas sp.]